MVKVLEDYQGKADKVRGHFNLLPVIERAREFRELSGELERKAAEVIGKGAPEEEAEELNRCYLLVSRHVNPIAHSNAGPAEQMSMETFGATPFPRIYEVVKLAEMTLHQLGDFKLLSTKLLRQRNTVEDGFYQANEAIRETLAKLTG